MDWSSWLPRIWEATQVTLYMVVTSALLTIVLGLPLGVLLVNTDTQGLMPQPWLNKILGVVVNIGRSLPFIILLVVIIPFTRVIVGTIIGPTAAIVPLTLAAIPFFARVVETAIREVDRGLVEAAKSMGATNFEVVVKVLIPEALPSILSGIALTVISLISYSAMAGAIGAGGLGDIAIRYGYQRREETVMLVTVVLLIVIVQGIQALGNWAANKVNRK